MKNSQGHDRRKAPLFLFYIAILGGFFPVHHAFLLVVPGRFGFPTVPRSKVFPRSLQSAASNDAFYDEDETENEHASVDDFSRDDTFRKRADRWILLVDDEESIRKAVGQLLFDSGFQVTACADAPTALTIAQERQDEAGNRRLPDVIVSDVRMPGEMDGLQFLQVIREDRQLQGIPVVLLTAKGMTQDRIAGYEAGADIYLPKPFDPDELLTICDGLIQQYETLNYGNGNGANGGGGGVEMEDLKQDLDEIKFMLLENGGGGVGNGWVDVGTNVFLAPDERQVLELLCQGLMNKEIAAKTFLSKRRVEQLLTSMYRKVNVKNRTELVRWAVSSGNVQI